LAEALDVTDLPAAIGAAEVLGELGDPRVLRSHKEDLAPLIEALNHPSRRVRFAAARAIAQLEPAAPFAGLSRWAEVLADCAGAQGKRAVLAAHPRRAVAQTLGGVFAGAGFEVRTATTGAEMIRRAVHATDLELLLVSDRINPESLWSWLEELRADPFTAELPVVIVASPGMLTAARRVAEAHPRVFAVPDATDAETMRGYLPRLREMAGREWVDQDERLRQAQVAIAALQQLLRPGLGDAHDLSRQQASLLAALDTPESSAGAARILARIATPQAQQSLLDYASLITWPLASRKAAAAAFAESVDVFGVLLTSAQIQQQYERYNQSRSLDAETQQVLSGLLDVIEASRHPELDSPSPQP
jgi:HEAT repeat protein